MESTLKPSDEKRDENDDTARISDDSKWIQIVSSVRFFFLVVPDIHFSGFSVLPLDLLYWWNHSSNLHSILINPIYTLHHVREASAIRHLSSMQLRATSVFARAYRGRRIHLPPLLLAFAELILWPQQNKNLLTPANFIFFAEILIAQRLEQLASNILQREEEDHADEILIQEQHMDPKIQPRQMIHLFPVSLRTPLSDDSNRSLLVAWKDLPRWVAELYYLNPISIFAVGFISNTTVPMNLSACCFQNLSVLAVVTALLESCRRPPHSSMLYSSFSLAVATYMECHSMVFLIPMILWQNSRSRRLSLLIGFAVWTAILQGLSLLLIGSIEDYFEVVATTHFYSFRLHHHTPSLSTLWYLSMQLFGRFQRYFELLLGGLPYFLLAPLTIRLYRYPSALVAIFWMLGVLFRPPGTLYQLNLGLCFILMNPRSIARMLQIPTLIALCAIPIPVIVYTVTYWMWLEPGNGEANYLYFQCLAYNIFVVILFLGFCSASLRRDKALRLTIKTMATNCHNVSAEKDQPN